MKDLTTWSSEPYANRCSELQVTATRFQGVVETIFELPTVRASSNLLIRAREFHLLLAYTHMTIDAVLESDGELIRQALNALMGDLRELGEQFALKHADFGSVGADYEKSLEEYVEISASLSQTEEVTILEQKMRDLANKSAGKEYTPFVFICSSSGTGKTNMAFSLNTPFLYFVHAKSSEQPVYKCF